VVFGEVAGQQLIACIECRDRKRPQAVECANPSKPI
jgi:hypothetical protein